MEVTRFASFSGLLGMVVGLASFAAAAQDTVRVSVDSSGAETEGYCHEAPAISADGQVVAFQSTATNLVAGDTNGRGDVFVHDRTSGTTERVSVDSSGAEANYESWFPAISADGNIVAFQSRATNLVAGDTNVAVDVFVHDRTSGTTERVSVDSSGTEANYDSHTVAISADGQVVAFQSFASNLVAGDTNGTYDVFVHDCATGITERVSVDSAGAEGNSDSGGLGYAGVSISADGQIVAFESNASNLVAGDTNAATDVFVHDRSTLVTERVSLRSTGKQGNSDSFQPSISGDGQVVGFSSVASNLVGGDTNGVADVFVHDRSTLVTERMSVDSSGSQGNGNSVMPSLSANGQVVAFVAFASNLVAGDTNGVGDEFVHDRSTGVTRRASVDSSGVQGNDVSYTSTAAITADGGAVAFGSWATNLVANDTNGSSDIFLHEDCWTPASWSNYGAGFPGTNGVPSLTSQQFPSFGATITVDLANSYGQPTVGWLALGLQRASIPTKWGGDLLVLPFLVAPISFSFGGDSFTGTISDDIHLCGTTIDLQGIEFDPGAAMGVSFSQGLELLIGN